jgi:hypothetical protein
MNSKILKAFFLAIFLILAFLVWRKNDIPVRDLKKEIALQHKYDSSQAIIDSMKVLIADANIVIANDNNLNIALIEQYKKQKDAISSLQKRMHNSDTVIRKYNSVQIESTFKNRYPAQYNPNDSTVTIGKAVGQASLIDLAHYDSLQLQIPLYAAADSILNLRIANRDSVISVKDNQISDYNSMIANYSNQRAVLVEQRNTAENQLKKQKFKTTISQIAGLAIIAALIIK